MVALLVAGQTAAYAAPANDDFSAATTVGTTPFTTTIDTTGATTDPTDPTGCANRGSVWFSFTPAVDGRVEAHTYGSDYYSVLSAWTGEQGFLTQVACNDDNGSQRSGIRFAVTAGTTYHLMVGTGGFGDTIGGSLRFSLDQAVAPANDDFADAITVGALPYAVGTTPARPPRPASPRPASPPATRPGTRTRRRPPARSRPARTRVTPASPPTRVPR
ncbi:hypothetical protein KBX37_12440 [Micromonospora sp. U56]|uniref:hypothetical protein n=1 Tax=Micromonospora sp. U56 TaxID=2824900 RepID=UPI001B372A8C|nr:hypothetical protein [Micromonospora sp. U56]MBQ0893895.1 hypothetical protein [Micromonospora sp. U56]